MLTPSSSGDLELLPLGDPLTSAHSWSLTQAGAHLQEGSSGGSRWQPGVGEGSCSQELSAAQVWVPKGPVGTFHGDWSWEVGGGWPPICDPISGGPQQRAPHQAAWPCIGGCACPLGQVILSPTRARLPLWSEVAGGETNPLCPPGAVGLPSL